MFLLIALLTCWTLFDMVLYLSLSLFCYMGGWFNLRGDVRWNIASFQVGSFAGGAVSPWGGCFWQWLSIELRVCKASGRLPLPPTTHQRALSMPQGVSYTWYNTPRLRDGRWAEPFARPHQMGCWIAFNQRVVIARIGALWVCSVSGSVFNGRSSMPINRLLSWLERCLLPALCLCQMSPKSGA